MATNTNGLGPTSHTFFSQRLRLSYVDYGNPDKPLLVLVHGSRDHARSWDFVAAGLADHYHVIAPDLRGHGDSAWAIGSQYAMAEYLLDLTQLLRHVGKSQATLVGHSLGGAIALHYTGIFPDSVTKVVAIEGLGPPPDMELDRPVEQRMVEWVETMQACAGRRPRHYDSLEEAEARMREANPHLSTAMAHHLTVHGTMRTEDGSYTWKFDNYVRAFPPQRYDREAVEGLWARITCPVLLIRGAKSWASDPTKDGRTAHFSDYTYAEIAGAGHWAHHDGFDQFMGHLTAFLELA